MGQYVSSRKNNSEIPSESSTKLWKFLEDSQNRIEEMKSSKKYQYLTFKLAKNGIEIDEKGTDSLFKDGSRECMYGLIFIASNPINRRWALLVWMPELAKEEEKDAYEENTRSFQKFIRPKGGLNFLKVRQPPFG